MKDISFFVKEANIKTTIWNYGADPPTDARMLGPVVPLTSVETPDLRKVIVQPAQLPDIQLSFEEGLVGDFLFDVRGQVGTLPLLQFTLNQLFQYREEQVLTLNV